MKKNSGRFILFLSFMLYILAICISMLGFNSISLAFLIIIAIFELYGIKKYVGFYNNIIIIFIVFSFLYGLSGPIVAMWGKKFLSIFIQTFNFNSWFLSYSLSEMGLILAIVLFYNNDERNSHNNSVNIDKKKIIYLAKISYIIMIIGFIFQLINLYRAGGFSVLLAGKAIYQSRETNLTLTLPATQLVNVSIACLSLYVGYCRFKNIKINKFIVIKVLLFFIPYLLQILLLGQRGNLLSIFIIFLLGFYYYKPLIHIKGKFIIIVFIIYLVSVFLYTNRGITSLLSDNKELFYNRMTDIRRYVDNINPGSNEFSAPFGNYNTLITSENYNYKYGESYLRGLLLSVPSFLYPGVKPIQITYEFRNNYFASFGEKSSISGTAFSSILEAYWNFNYIGVFILYFIYGSVLVKIEKSHKFKSEFYKIYYFLFVASIVSFSRTQLGGIINVILYYSIYVLLFLILPYKLIIDKSEGVRF